MFLEGKKVGLRSLREEDAEFFAKHLNDQAVLMFLSLYRPISLTGEKEWIHGLDKKETDVVLAIQPLKSGPSDQIIGSVGLHHINFKDRHATFGIVIADRSFQSKGLGPEAARLMIGYGFNQLNLNRVNSSAIDFNERSLKMHRRLGFTEEGRARQKFFRNGGYHDEVIFGLLRAEWAEKT